MLPKTLGCFWGTEDLLLTQSYGKECFKGIEVYKGRSFAEKIAVLPGQVRKKIDYMMSRGEHLTITGASIVLAE